MTANVTVTFVGTGGATSASVYDHDLLKDWFDSNPRRIERTSAFNVTVTVGAGRSIVTVVVNPAVGLVMAVPFTFTVQSHASIAPPIGAVGTTHVKFQLIVVSVA